MHSSAGWTVSPGGGGPERGFRSLWDCDWLLPTTAPAKPAPAEPAERETVLMHPADRHTTDPCPGPTPPDLVDTPAVTVTETRPATGGRQPPLRLVLIRAVGGENIWSSRPAHDQQSSTSHPPPQPQQQHRSVADPDF